MSKTKNKRLIPKIYNIGYIGIGSHKQSTHKKQYIIWRSMLERCYGNRPEKFKSYKGVTICKDWHNFQNFSKWFELNYVHGYALDKDLLSDTKIYSPDNCIFIPTALNNFLTNKKKVNTSGKTWVSWNKQKKKWATQITINNKITSLGFYLDIEEASNAYQKARAEQAEVWKQRMVGILPPHAIERIK